MTQQQEYAQFTEVCRRNRDIPVTFERWVELQEAKMPIANRMPKENKLMDLDEALHHLQECITNLENVAANDEDGEYYKSHLIEMLRRAGSGNGAGIQDWIYDIQTR